MKDFDTIGGRRYLMCMGACIATTTLCYFGRVDPKTYGDVVVWIIGIYVTGNVAQRTGSALPDAFSKIGDTIKAVKSSAIDSTQSPAQDTPQ